MGIQSHKKIERIKNSGTKKNGKKMRSSFTITIFVLSLFLILIIFSIFNGRVKQDAVDFQDSVQDNIFEKRTAQKFINPTVNINLAISSNDISKCNKDKDCEDWFYFSKSLEPNDCDKIENYELENNCKDNIFLEKAENSNDSNYCLNIKNIVVKDTCLKETK